jgi:methyl-accepting chemotaxis protein
LKKNLISYFESFSIKNKYIITTAVISFSFLLIIVFAITGIKTYEKSNDYLLEAVKRSNEITGIKAEMSRIHNSISLQLIDGQKRSLVLDYEKTLLKEWFDTSIVCKRSHDLNCDHFIKLWKDYLKLASEIHNEYKKIDPTLPEYLAANTLDIYKIRIGTSGSRIKDNSLYAWLQKAKASGGFDPVIRDYLNPVGEAFDKAVQIERTGERELLNTQLVKTISALEDAKYGIQDLFERNEKYSLIFKNRLGDIFSEIENMFTTAGKNELEELNSKRDTLHIQGNFLTVTLIFVALISSIMVILIFYLLIVTTINPIMTTRKKLEDLSKKGGDLSELLPVISKDEIGQMTTSLNDFFVNLRNIIKSVKSSTEELHYISRSISNGTSDASMRISETSTHTEDISSRLSETANHLATTAKTMENMSSIIKEVSIKSDSGSKLLNNALDSMKELQDASTEIQDVNEVINEIAFQTNILSLNAAIEAARAGEYGKGFAVVADEVRDLSLRSSEGALQIKKLINDASRKIEKGTELVKNSSGFFFEILNEFKNIFTEIENLSNELRNNSTGVEQIDKAVETIKDTINNNAAFIEEMAAAAKDMTDHANILHKEVERFKV